MDFIRAELIRMNDYKDSALYKLEKIISDPTNYIPMYIGECQEATLTERIFKFCKSE